MREAVIVLPVRTAVGRFGGVFRGMPAQTLAAHLIREVVTRSGIDGADIDDVILGQGAPNGEAPALGRVAALDAGVGIEVPGMQLDRRCGSGLQAVIEASMQVATGAADLVLAGGAESMSQTEYYVMNLRWGIHGTNISLEDRLSRARVTAGGKDHLIMGGMVETAENLRARFAICREDQDLLALQSHHRAVTAHAEGRFSEEIVPVEVTTRSGETVMVAQDEHPRSDTSLESLMALTPMRANVDPESTVTAGNSSGQNDGAALCVVTTRERAAALGIQPRLRLVTWSVAGVDPAFMGLGPIPAVEKALHRAGLTLEDMGVIELNEAFAVQALSVLRSWKRDPADDAINPNGSGIALGHPIGATGARILATLAHEMHRRGCRFGLETMCIGGGQGIAAIFEQIDG